MFNALNERTVTASPPYAYSEHAEDRLRTAEIGPWEAVKKVKTASGIVTGKHKRLSSV
jgi:hypothetical protein